MQINPKGIIYLPRSVEIFPFQIMMMMLPWQSRYRRFFVVVIGAYALALLKHQQIVVDGFRFPSKWIANSNNFHHQREPLKDYGFKAAVRRRNPLISASIDPENIVDRDEWVGALNAHRPYTAVMIVPTGVGASIGGYAGDALPAARLLSTVADRVITHPNVMNGAMLYWPNTESSESGSSVDKLLYVEGNALNDFAKGDILLQCLHGRRGQKIGVILDHGIEEDLFLRHVQVCNAMKATLGIDIHQIVKTSHPVGVTTQISSESGASWGTIENSETLINAAKVLKENGCTAIAVIARFPEEQPNSEEAAQFDAYRKGEGVDAIAGVESLISHIISQEVGLPCAHAPAFAAMEVEKDVSPKACAEELGYTFLPCVLANLHRTPNLIRLPKEATDNLNLLYRPIECIHASDVDAVVVPVRSFISMNSLILTPHP